MPTQVVLRRYVDADIEASYHAVIESFGSLSRWMAWCDESYSIDSAREWFERQATAWASALEWNFVISDAEGAFLGAAGIHAIDKQNYVAEAGYWVRTSAAGRGVATEALRQLVDWAFDCQALHRLDVIASVENTASVRVAEKAGFRREALLARRLLVQGARHDGVLLTRIAGLFSDALRF